MSFPYPIPLSALLLHGLKDLIDDYDMMASGLSNNLIDFDMPVYVVKGFEGDNLDELQQNIKTKKIIGMEATDQGAGLEVHTIEIPHEARKEKLELDEKNIYRSLTVFRAETCFLLLSRRKKGIKPYSSKYMASSPSS